MINFVEYDPKQIIDEMIKGFENATGEALYPADERRIFLQQLLPVIISLKADINNTGNQNLLRYAQGNMLDELGEMFDVMRIAPKIASCTIRYNLAAPLPYDILIKKGSRTTTDGTFVFNTALDVTIKAGTAFVDVNANASGSGADYNGLVPHQIASMIDVLPYIESVYNTTQTSGGSDIESDNDYRSRIKISYEQHSTAGSENAYQFWAKSVSNEVADVSVENESPGNVNVYILPKDGYTAGQSLIDRVTKVLSSDKHRPLTDSVFVQSAVKFDYDIVLTYYISTKDLADEQVIRTKAENAIEEFKRQTSMSLGLNINPDLLRSLMLACGVYKIDIESPEYTELTKNQVGIANTVAVTYGGVKSSWN